MTEYLYQYDFDGFPLAKAVDIARRMKYHKVKFFKKCAGKTTDEKGHTIDCPNTAINKPNHKFCLDHMLNNYADNRQLTEFFPLEAKVES